MHALIFCWQACRTNRTTIEPCIEPHNRRVEPVEPVEFQKSKTFTSSRFYWFYWFYTPVVWFYTWFYGGSIGSTRLPTKNEAAHKAWVVHKVCQGYSPMECGMALGMRDFGYTRCSLVCHRAPRPNPLAKSAAPQAKRNTNKTKKRNGIYSM